MYICHWLAFLKVDLAKSVPTFSIVMELVENQQFTAEKEESGALLN